MSPAALFGSGECEAGVPDLSWPWWVTAQLAPETQSVNNINTETDRDGCEVGNNTALQMKPDLSLAEDLLALQPDMTLRYRTTAFRIRFYSSDPSLAFAYRNRFHQTVSDKDNLSKWMKKKSS